MPEEGFTVEHCEVLGKAVAGSPCAGGLDVVDQHGEVERRMAVDQQMDMIRLAAELKQGAAPRSEDLGKGRFEVGQQGRRQGFAPVLGHEHDMQLEVKNRMRARTCGVFHHCGLIRLW